MNLAQILLDYDLSMLRFNMNFVFTTTYCLNETLHRCSGLKLLIDINLSFDLFMAFNRKQISYVDKLTDEDKDNQPH